KEGEEVLQALEQIPLQPVVKTMMRQAVPLQPMEVNSGADILLQPVEDPTPEQVNVPEGGCDPMGSPCRTCDPVERRAHVGAGLLAGLVTLWETHAGTVCS
ncbi:unnamed protein product, partial [Bubo scandiacus]